MPNQLEDKLRKEASAQGLKGEKADAYVSCACGCGITFTRFDKKNRERKFISGHNKNSWNTANPNKKETLFCENCGKEVKKYISQIENYSFTTCSTNCRAKVVGRILSESLDYKEKSRQIALKNGNVPPKHLKENHWNWQGGIHEGKSTERQSADYIKWRKAILSKDNYTCQICKIRGGKLSAHHIKEWSKFPELRFSLENGQCLCYTCHMKLHGLCHVN